MMTNRDKKIGFVIVFAMFLIILPFILRNRTNKPVLKKTDSSELLISTIEIKLKATSEELKIFEDGIVPWISLEQPENEIDSLIDSDKIVLPYPTSTLIISYPLKKPANFELKKSNGGWTKKQLIEEICLRYQFVYKEEARTTAIKNLSPELRDRLPKRNKTNEKYEIWGHDLKDLDLSGIEVYNSKGKIEVRPLVES